MFICRQCGKLSIKCNVLCKIYLFLTFTFIYMFPLDYRKSCLVQLRDFRCVRCFLLMMLPYIWPMFLSVVDWITMIHVSGASLC